MRPPHLSVVKNPGSEEAHPIDTQLKNELLLMLDLIEAAQIHAAAITKAEPFRKYSGDLLGLIEGLRELHKNITATYEADLHEKSEFQN